MITISTSRKFDTLLTRTRELRDRIQNNEGSMMEVDLKTIFFELKKELSPSDLELGLQIMDNGTHILERKLEEITQFIVFLTERDKILSFLKRGPSEIQLARLLKPAWMAPFRFPHFSLKFLTKSWDQLVGRKPDRGAGSKFEHPSLTDKEPPEIIDSFEEPYEDQMLGYFKEISHLFPATMEEILASDGADENYFEHFSYILHLLQGGYLQFEKTTKIFSLQQNDPKESPSNYFTGDTLL